MALRLVASMQRDWIQAGRRPSGICGAALYLAAIYHEKPRTYKDVGRIVRVSPETIKRRVDGVCVSLCVCVCVCVCLYDRMVYEGLCLRASWDQD